MGAAHASLSVAKLWPASEVQKAGACQGALLLGFSRFFEKNRVKLFILCTFLCHFNASADSYVSAKLVFRQSGGVSTAGNACSPDVRHNPKSLFFGLETKKTYVAVCPSVPLFKRSIMTRGYPRADFAGTSLASRADGFRQSAGPPSGRAGEVAFPSTHRRPRRVGPPPPQGFGLQRVRAASGSPTFNLPPPGPAERRRPRGEKTPPAAATKCAASTPVSRRRTFRSPPARKGRQIPQSIGGRPEGRSSRPRASPAGNHRMPTSPPARAAFREGPQKAPGQALCYIVA